MICLNTYNIITLCSLIEHNIINKGGYTMSKDKKKNILRYKKDYLNEESRQGRQPLKMQIHKEEK